MKEDFGRGRVGKTIINVPEEFRFVYGKEIIIGKFRSGVLYFCPKDKFEESIEVISMPIKAKKFILANSLEAKIDGNGRIKISKELKDLIGDSGPEGEVPFIGAGGDLTWWFEVWPIHLLENLKGG
jgi:DNA-binding transcriptional regulator/RsmH inhibitor MraZ